VGAAADRGVPDRATLKGLGNLSPAQGLLALQRVLVANPVQTAVIPARWPTLAQALPFEKAFLSELAGTESKARAGHEISERPPETPSLVHRLKSATPKEQRHLLRQYVKGLALRVLQLDPTEEPDVRQPLNEMGLDSLMAVELRNLLGAGLSLSKTLPATLVFDHPSILELADYLGRDVLGLARGEESQTPSAPTADGLDGLLDKIEQLSEDEVERRIGGPSGGKTS
jgi:hypothetical protein